MIVNIHILQLCVLKNTKHQYTNIRGQTPCTAIVRKGYISDRNTTGYCKQLMYGSTCVIYQSIIYKVLCSAELLIEPQINVDCIHYITKKKKNCVWLFCCFFKKNESGLCLLADTIIILASEPNHLTKWSALITNHLINAVWHYVMAAWHHIKIDRQIVSGRE